MPVRGVWDVGQGSGRIDAVESADPNHRDRDATGLTEEVRARGLEPPRPGPPAPKAGASTSSATPACAGILRGLAVAVAQLVVAPGCGPGGRGFESHRSPSTRPDSARARSSGDRATDFESVCRTFESCRAHRTTKPIVAMHPSLGSAPDTHRHTGLLERQTGPLSRMDDVHVPSRCSLCGRLRPAMALLRNRAVDAGDKPCKCAVLTWRLRTRKVDCQDGDMGTPWGSRRGGSER